MLAKDSTSGTVLIATILCVVCSLAVSAAAVALKPAQEVNAKLDQKKNILDAAGIPNDEFGKSAATLSKAEIDDLYTWVEEKMVDLDTGDYDADFDKSTFNLEEQATDMSMSEPIVGEPYDNGEDRRPKTMKVFLVRHEGKGPIQQVVLPIYGKGLWGTLWGYLALQSDLKTVQGITFYQHKETPGLGGEVDNPAWKAQWDGLQLYDENGKPAAHVAKGPAPSSDPSAVDGLSGATITSRGVTDLVQYWASDQGYGPFLKKLKAQIEDPGAAGAEESPSTDKSTTKVGA